MKQAEQQPDANPGFQIAPMIDVVFVIMLFFMVMAGAVKVEHELKTTLPGNAETAKEMAAAFEAAARGAHARCGDEGLAAGQCPFGAGFGPVAAARHGPQRRAAG